MRAEAAAAGMAGAFRWYRAQARRQPENLPAMSSTATTRHVLYVEDDRINIVLMEEVFRLMPGWTLHCAETGALALAALRERRPDLVLMDMNLPDMTGLELMARLNAEPDLAGLPCVALSADVMDDQLARARAAGFRDYWLKPIDVLQLQAGLRELLASRPAQPR